MPASLTARLLRWKFRLFPAYRGTGGRVTHISEDFRQVRVEIPLNWRTRNYVGTIFGGSLYGAVDPILMIQLMQILGKEYTVWDKAATIRFRRPGRSTLFASFEVGAQEIATIRELCETRRSVDRSYNIEIVDAAGVVHASVEKVLFIQKRMKPECPRPVLG